jgi:hypothetical protein
MLHYLATLTATAAFLGQIHRGKVAGALGPAHNPTNEVICGKCRLRAGGTELPDNNINCLSIVCLQ